MTNEEWMRAVEGNWDELKSLVMGYHPRASYRPGPLPITARMAEAACEQVREQIRSEGNPVTEDLLERLKEDGNVQELSTLFSGAWFGVPDSTSCWGIPGFGVLCNLLEDPPEEC